MRRNSSMGTHLAPTPILLLFVVSLLFSLGSWADGLAGRANRDMPPSISTVFNTPGFSNQSTLTIENKLIQTITEALPGSSIRVAMYILDRPSVARALVLAAERQIDVQLVLDGRNERYADASAIDIVINGFAGHSGIESCSEKPCVKFCHGPLSALKLGHGNIGGSCHGLVINHNKFFLFSALTGARQDVVIQTSANIDQYQLRKYNDLVEIDNDADLYQGYANYWAGLKRDRTRLTAPCGFTGLSGTRVYLFPRLIGKDPVVGLLKRVSCELPGSTIRASESDFGRIGVSKELARLERAGCSVRILVVDDPELQQPGQKARRLLGDSLALIRDRYQDDTNSVHTKLMLIDASIDGSPLKKKVILTGSHNLDQFSEKTNDETLLEINDEKTYETYLTFWKQIVTEAHDAKIADFVQPPTVLAARP